MCKFTDIEWFLSVVPKGVKTVQWIRKEIQKIKVGSSFKLTTLTKNVVILKHDS